MDLDATVTAYARSGRLLPVLGPAPERWFEATVVVDTSLSMAPWRGAAAELVRLADHTGAFRTVRRLDVTGSSEGFALRTPAGRRVAPGELLNPDGRRLTMVFSDFSSGFWHEAAAWAVLRKWASHGPTVAVSPLPQRLWRRTGLNLTAARVVSRRPGGPNRELVGERQGDGGQAGVRRASVPVPVLSLTPSALGGWARVVMHVGAESCDAVLLPPGGRLVRSRVRGMDGGGRSGPGADVTIGKRLTDFLTTASDAAISLAVLTTPYQSLGLPVLNLLRQAVTADVTTADVAEVLLSGLFVVEQDEQGGLSLTLRSEARGELSARLTKRDLWRSYEAVTRVVDAVKALPGRTVVGVEDARGSVAVADDVQPFAAAHRDLLVVLGAAPAPEQVPDSASEQVSDQVSDRRSQGPVILTSPGDPEPAPYFFLSYAHAPRAGEKGRDLSWIRRFFRDLCKQLAQIDRRWDHDWALPGIKDIALLARSQAFVPLYSPEYFDSVDCGREWAFFHSSSNAILPVLWKPLEDRLPAAASEIQMEDLSLGDQYYERGLFELMRVDRNQEYVAIVFKLAQRIIDLAERPSPRLWTPGDLETVRPLFPETETARQTETGSA